LQSIEVEGVDTEIAAVDWAALSTAMRYSFVVKMDAIGAREGSEFLIRASRFDLRSNNMTNVNPFYGSKPGEANAYAILR